MPKGFNATLTVNGQEYPISDAKVSMADYYSTPVGKITVHGKAHTWEAKLLAWEWSYDGKLRVQTSFHLAIIPDTRLTLEIFAPDCEPATWYVSENHGDGWHTLRVPTKAEKQAIGLTKVAQVFASQGVTTQQAVDSLKAAAKPKKPVCKECGKEYIAGGTELCLACLNTQWVADYYKNSLAGIPNSLVGIPTTTKKQSPATPPRWKPILWHNGEAYQVRIDREYNDGMIAVAVESYKTFCGKIWDEVTLERQSSKMSHMEITAIVGNGVALRPKATPPNTSGWEKYSKTPPQTQPKQQSKPLQKNRPTRCFRFDDD